MFRDRGGSRFLIVVWLLVFVAGCYLPRDPIIRVGTSPWPGYDPLYVARSAGFFEETPIQLVEYPSAPEVVRAFQNGALDVAAVTADEFLRLAGEVDDLAIILVADFSEGGDALVVKPSIATPQALIGKRVGVEANALGIYMLGRALDRSGLSLDQIVVVKVENTHHFSRFQSDLDAVVTFEPHLSKIVAAGGRAVFSSADIPGEVTDFLVVRRSLISSRKEALHVLLRGWFRGIDPTIAKQRNILELMGKRHNISPEMYTNALSRIKVPSLQENRLLLADGQGPVAMGLARVEKALRERSWLTRPINPAALLEPSLVNQLEP